MTDVFLSYSRKDKAFVQTLHDSLRAQQREIWVDWQAIPLTADWWQEIERGIEGTNTFVFVISPDSVVSDVCRQEIDHAVKHNKRLVPIVHREGFEAAQVHPMLSKYNWLFFRETDEFDRGFADLITAIETDLEYVRSHTRLTERAVEWENQVRNESFVLRGDDLKFAEQWLATGEQKTPVPTELQREYIRASRTTEEATQILIEAGQKAEKLVQDAKRRAAIASAVFGVALMGAGIAGSWAFKERSDARSTRENAQKTEQAANQKVTDAERRAQGITQRADQQLKSAVARVKLAETKVKRAQTDVDRAKAEQAKVQAESKQQSLEAQRKVAAAGQQTQAAKQQTAEAELKRQIANEEVNIAEGRLREAKGAVNVATAEVQQKVTALQKLDVDLKQAQNQINLSQQALTEGVGDVPARIAQQTGQKPAIVYVSFISSKQGDRSSEDDPLGLLLITAAGPPLRWQVPQSNRSEVMKVVFEFRRSVLNPRSRNYLVSSQKLYTWLIKPLEEELQKQGINNLVFLADSSFRAMPIAALHDGQKFLVEKYSVGMMPGFSLTDTHPVNLRDAPVLVMGISKQVTPDLTALPGVATEVAQIMKLRSGKSFLNEEVTLQNLKLQRQKYPFKIIHLATHANFTLKELDKSFIQFWDTKLRLNQLDQLGWYDPSVELLVLSACETGIGDQESKFKFGFAGLAIKAGVKSILASLWNVEDFATAELMTEFYKQLRVAPTRSEALRQAQIAMLKSPMIEQNRSLVKAGARPSPEKPTKRSHPYYWASFTIIGNPW
ncbi:CHAT domain-containing protein [Phormidesmis sp. 146-12]